jgi:hypothetical protein
MDRWRLFMGKPNEALEAPSVEVDISEADELAGIESAAKTEKAERAEKPAKDAKTADTKKPQEETVPHQALHEEREKRKAIEKQYREEKKANEESRTRLDERLRILNEAITPRQQPIDPRTNPAGYAQQVASEVAALKTKVSGYEQQQADTQRQEQEENRLWTAYRASGREFTKASPDFPEAYNFLLASRYQELQAMGFDEGTIAEALKNDERNLAINAQQTGSDPAETIYKWASARGFKAGGTPSAKNGKGGDLDRLKTAQDASETLSKSGGSASDAGRLSLKSIERMSDDEFRALTAKMTRTDPDGMDKLMARLEGGRA